MRMKYFEPHKEMVYKKIQELTVMTRIDLIF